METRLTSHVLLLGLSLIACNGAVAAGMPDFYEEPGLNPARSLHQTDFDAVDPFTGKLQLHHTDILIPGNGGMDLAVTRSYTSGNVWDVGFGYSGWTMDFGYVEMPGYNVLCATGNFVNNASNPVLVTPDGGRQVLADVSVNFPTPAYTFPYITKNFWKATCVGATNGGLIVTSPEGKTYEMSYVTSAMVGSVLYYRYYVTKITDKHGNWISINYFTSQTNGALINSVTTNDGRTLTYAYTIPDQYGFIQLASITDGSRTWTYSYIDGVAMGMPVGTYLLSKVTLPDNSAWNYIYNGNLGTAGNVADGTFHFIPGSFQMKSVITPQGAMTNYNYMFSPFNSLGGYEMVVSSRTVAGGATWTYTYTPSSGFGVYDQTAVTMNDPATGKNQTDTYSHFGYGTVADNGELWKIGLLARKTIGTKQTEDYVWSFNVVTDRQIDYRVFPWTLKTDNGLYAPKLLSKTITRDGASFATNYTNIDWFGNAWGQTEAGPGGKNRTKMFHYSATTYYDPLWILHQQTYEYYNGFAHTQILNSLNDVLMDSKAMVTTSYTYNADGTVATMTPPGGATYTYDQYGFPTGTPTTLHGTSYSGYFRGIPQTEVQQDGISLSRVVDSAGEVTSGTNGNGKITTYSYDGLGRLTSINHPINNPVSITYTLCTVVPASPQPLQINATKTATRGALVANTTYDGFGRPLNVTVGGIATTYQYDAMGRVIFKSDPNSATGTHYSYDELGRVTSVTNADGTSKTTRYGSLTRTVTDENGHSTIYTYYAYGNPDETYLTSITAPDAAANITITRDVRDYVSSVTQAGVTRNYLYGANGYLYQQTDPETGVTDYGRDDAGNMTSRVVAGTTWETFAYDYHNRLTTANTASTATTNAYSKTSKLLSSAASTFYVLGGNVITLNSSTRSFNYDDNDNLVGNNLLIDGRNLMAGYSYNSNDQLSSITYPLSNKTVSFAPDVLGRPTVVSGYVSNAAYWPSGQVQQISYQNGATSTYGQNARLWPSSFSTQNSTGNLINSSYLYDPVGNLTSISDSTTPAFNRVFGYDLLDRLTTVNASGSWGNGTIGYDGSGNITSQTFGASGMTYTYSATNQLTSVTGALRNASYTYDVGGNIRTNGTGKTFSFNVKNQLMQIDDSTTGAVTAYTYDGLDHRASVQKNGVLTYEFYDLTGKLLAEFAPSQGNKLTEYMYLGGMRIAQRVSNQ